MNPAPLRAPGERPLTPMERHAALGPIAWTDGGMRATTQDGFRVEIHSRLLDAVAERWTAYVWTPKAYEGCLRVEIPCQDLTEARAEIAQQITECRQEEAAIQGAARAADREDRG